MEVRFGYVAMSVQLENASPSKTMTATQFAKLQDHEAAITKLIRIAKENLRNCERLIYHNVWNKISFFRLSSRLVPLATHELTHGWDYLSDLKQELLSLGNLIEEHQIRVDFHPDHFVVLNSPHEEVINRSVQTLLYHIGLLQGMKQNPIHRCILHVGGAYREKQKALNRFIGQIDQLDPLIKNSLLLENDDKIYTASDVLFLSEQVGIPMVLDLHHHRCNQEVGDLEEIWPRIVHTWNQSPLPVKIHVSSPKNEKDFRSHADYVEVEDIAPFLKMAARYVDQLDVMIEAKRKDEALLKLMKNLHGIEGIHVATPSKVLVQS